MLDNSFIESIKDELPVEPISYELRGKKAGLLIVDIVNGFATVGAGALAPPVQNKQIDQMVEQSNQLAKEFLDSQKPVALFLDTHEPGKPEPPYPPHCEKGTGEEELVPALKWLENEKNATLIKKDCINGFVGSIENTTNQNHVVNWCKSNQLETLIVVGICTDICVMDFVLTMLSARNHEMVPGLKDIVVYEPGCATYDLPKPVVSELKLPKTATHPQYVTHHLGLYFMASRGAIIASKLQ